MINPYLHEKIVADLQVKLQGLKFKLSGSVVANFELHSEVCLYNGILNENIDIEGNSLQVDRYKIYQTYHLDGTFRT